jgi:methylmalonyl-CoA mutase cobalamin-binding subunit
VVELSLEVSCDEVDQPGVQERSMIEGVDRGPTLAVAMNRDLLFGSRIRSALNSLGLEARFVSAAEQFVEALREQEATVAIGIIDMNGAVAWTVIREWLSRAGSDRVPTLAFGPHVDIEGRRAAKAAGVTRIVSNGQFHDDMTGLIDRYRRR